MKKRLTLVALGLAMAALAGCANAPFDNSAPEPTGETTTRSNVVGGLATCQYNVAGEAAKPVDPPPTADITATGETSVTLSFAEGPVTVTMDRARTPCTINSFLSLLQQGFYDGVRCHRLTTEGIFVLQCGDPTETGRGGPGYTYADETYSDDTYPAGTVAMANAGADTNGSQFFLVYQDSTLSPNYTVFGHMDAASTAVIAQIASEGTESGTDGPPRNSAVIERYSMG